MPSAIDLFCGAGGFSEGLLQAGFDILFSSDKSSMVRDTYVNRHTQLGIREGIDTHFELADIRELTGEFVFDKINNLNLGEVYAIHDIDAIFGGPPCQGFSRAGKRDASDPRNMLFNEYLRLVSEIKPKYVVMENVVGILDMQMLDFPSVLSTSEIYEGQNMVADILRTELTGLGYKMLKPQVLNASDYGVPQQRKRVIFLAYRNDVAPLKYPEKGVDKFTVGDALSMLGTKENGSGPFAVESVNGRTPSKKTKKAVKSKEIKNMELSTHSQTTTQRFSLYSFGENKTAVLSRLREEGINLLKSYPELFYETLYQVNSTENKKIIIEALEKLKLSKNINITSLSLNHINKALSSLSMLEKFDDNVNLGGLIKLMMKLKCNKNKAVLFWEEIKQKINPSISEERLNRHLINGEISDEIANALFTKKGMRTRLDPDKPSPTIITLPDDFIHPYENRILTVREMARLQSFDDSFEFLGKRTTGGSMRAKEIPQFTQVGNAVPPLLANAIAKEVYQAIKSN